MGIAFGILGGIVLLLIWRCIVLEIKCHELSYAHKDESLKNQIFPHTVRNKIENYRIRTKELKKMTDDLCNEINGVSDFLGVDGEGVWK